MGGKSFGFDIPRLTKLAQGGIIDKPTIAQVGEAGPEAVVPLKNTPFVDAIGSAVAKAVASELRAQNNGNGLNNENTNLEVTVKVGDTTFGRAAAKAINKAQRQAGKVLLEV